jgi:hypothetical protein
MIGTLIMLAVGNTVSRLQVPHIDPRFAVKILQQRFQLFRQDRIGGIVFRRRRLRFGSADKNKTGSEGQAHIFHLHHSGL